MKKLIFIGLLAATAFAAPVYAQQSRFERLFSIPAAYSSQPMLLSRAFDVGEEFDASPRVYRSFSLRDTLISARLETLPYSREAALIGEPLYVGQRAPDFMLPDQNGKLHRLSELRGKTVVLSFYPQDSYAMCTGIAVDFDRARPAFDTRDAVVFSVSVQPVRSKHAMARAFGIARHPLLADSDRVVARAYGVLNQDGLAARMTFIIGPGGDTVSTSRSTNRQSYVSDVLSTLDQIRARARHSAAFYVG